MLNFTMSFINLKPLILPLITIQFLIFVPYHITNFLIPLYQPKEYSFDLTNKLKFFRIFFL